MIPSTARHTALAVLLGASVLVAAVSPARADGPSRPPAIEALKRAYLDCECSAARGKLDTGGVMSCSVLYEELKSRAFGGSFVVLRRWFDLQTAGPEGAGV